MTLSWGDYVTVPPLPDEVFIDEKKQFDPAYRNVAVAARARSGDAPPAGPEERARAAGHRARLGRRAAPGGALVLEAHARPYTLDQPDGTQAQCDGADGDGRQPPRHTRAAASATSPSRSRCGWRCARAAGLYPRANVTGYASSDLDAALADLHYCDVADYAVGCNTSAGWAAGRRRRGPRRPYRFPARRRGRARRAERRHRRCRIRHGGAGRARSERPGCLARRARASFRRTTKPGSRSSEATIAGIAGAPRQATAQRLIASARQARDRIAAGIALLRRGSPRAPRIPGDERGGRTRRPAARGRSGRRSRRRSAPRNGGRSSSPSSCSTFPACRTGCIPTARSWTCSSSRPAAARRRPISASPPGRSRIAASPTAARSAPALPC